MTTETKKVQTTAAVAVVRDDGYMVGLADHGVPGYTPTTWEYDTYEEAKDAADLMNEKWGLTPREASEIVLSTIRLRR